MRAAYPPFTSFAFPIQLVKCTNGEQVVVKFSLENLNISSQEKQKVLHVASMLHSRVHVEACLAGKSVFRIVFTTGQTLHNRLKYLNNFRNWDQAELMQLNLFS